MTDVGKDYLLTELQNGILKEIKLEPKLTAVVLAERLHQSPRTIERTIKVLKEL